MSKTLQDKLNESNHLEELRHIIKDEKIVKEIIKYFQGVNIRLPTLYKYNLNLMKIDVYTSMAKGFACKESLARKYSMSGRRIRSLYYRMKKVKKSLTNLNKASK